MQGNLTPGYGLWLEPLVALAVGTVVIVGLAALAGRFLRTAVWQRTIWQAATVGLLALVVVELTGTASALVRLVYIEPEAATQQPDLPGPTVRTEPSQTPTEIATRQPEDRRAGLAVGEGEEASVRPTGWTEQTSSPSSSHTWFPSSSLGTLVFRPIPANRPVPKLELGNQNVDAPGRSTGTGAVLIAESDQAWWPGWIWVLGAAAIVGRFAWTRSMLSVFRRRHGVLEDADLHTRVGRLARRLGIRRPVTVLEAAGLATPVAFGSFRPTLALPVGFSRDFEPPQQEAIIVHELAHLAASDPAWQSVADLSCAVLWWHPLSWWSRRQLRAANEVAADEASLIIPEGPDVLASCLVALGRRLAGRRPRRLGWLAVNGPGFRSALGRRVERLLTLPARSWRTPGRVRSLFAKTTLPVALVILAILSTAWARSQAA
jgi:beta-lactamase regulating signal transducer with metallopeptidase domain